MQSYNNITLQKKQSEVLNPSLGIPSTIGVSPLCSTSRLLTKVSTSRYLTILSKFPLSSAEKEEGWQDGLFYVIDLKNRIVGYKALRKFLTPRHPYFEDKWGEVKDYKKYRREGATHYLYYPVLSKETPKDNPYRLYRRARGHTSRVLRKLLNVMGEWSTYDIGDVGLVKLDLTMPEKMSEWLVAQEKGVELAWGIFKDFWEVLKAIDLEGRVCGVWGRVSKKNPGVWYPKKRLNKKKTHNRLPGEGLGALVNLHLWETKNPLNPHVHFHCLIPSYCFSQDGDKWEASFWGLEISNQALARIKDVWKKCLVAFAERQGIKERAIFPGGNVDVRVQYIPLDNEDGKARVACRLNYQSRHWIEDFVEYSDKLLQKQKKVCDNPPEWLEAYKNRGRAFGWWREMSKIGIKDKRKKEYKKVFELTGEELESCGVETLDGMLASGELGYLDLGKGKPIFEDLTEDDIAWLKRCSAPPGVAGGRCSPLSKVDLD